MGNSDPGRNGLLSPWGNINGLYFDDSMETGNYLWNLQNDLQEYYGQKGKIYIKINLDNEEDYYKMMSNLQNFSEHVQCYGTSLENHFGIVMETTDYYNDDNYDEPEEPPKKPKKSKKK